MACQSESHYEAPLLTAKWRPTLLPIPLQGILMLPTGLFEQWLLVSLLADRLISGAAALVTDVVSSDYDSEHWGTEGSYLLGDADISSDCQNIDSRVMSLKLNATLIKADTAAEVWQRGEPFDLSQPAYQDFPLRGIFTVLLGGGSTTGVISTVGNAGPWVIEQIERIRSRPDQVG